MKFINKIVIIALIITSFKVTAQERTKIDGVAAVVGKNIVLYSEVKAAKQQLDQESKGTNKLTECNIIEKILTDKLLAHHAVIDSMVVDEANINSEVDRKIAYFKQQLGSKEKLLDFFGFSSLTDIKKELFNVEKENQLVRKMQQSITAGVDVTPEEVSSYFKSLEKEDAIPEFGTEVEIGQIVLEAKNSEEENQKMIDKLNKIKSDIESGMGSFRMKAILYSQDPAASKGKEGEGGGGLYKGITKQTQFVKEFKDAAFSLEEGEISEPFKSQFGYHIVKVEKIQGKSRDVRHILLQSEVSDEILTQVKDSLVAIRNDILTNKISFEDAVVKYSSDKETNKNYGLLINPQRNDTFFDLTNMPPEIYARISELKQGELSEVFYDETREGKKMYKFLLVKSKIPAHKANLDKDYVKIKRLALQKKKSELVQKWTNEKIQDTYIKIHNQYKDCDFEYNWTKK
jgi:peptidyl-prolyl cis-trans isomerase SurA